MQAKKIIPVLRIFDYQKAVEFYVGWLGFEIVWEHTFEKDTPVYMELSRDGITLHLSEHHGDASPGSYVFIWVEGLAAYHEELINKKYKYGRPGMEKTFYDAWCVMVHDPFGNRISFNEKIG